MKNILLLVVIFMMYNLMRQMQAPQISQKAIVPVKVVYKEKPVRPKVPMTIATQYVGPFRQVGYLYGPDNVMMPLLGRRIHRGATRFNYYTLSNHENPIKIPIVRRRDCMDRNGCDELYDDDKVFIKELNSEFSVKIYDRHSLRYNPDYI